MTKIVSRASLAEFLTATTRSGDTSVSGTSGSLDHALRGGERPKKGAEVETENLSDSELRILVTVSDDDAGGLQVCLCSVRFELSPPTLDSSLFFGPG